MLQATVASLSDEEMAAPSRCEGWTRADVIAHVASSGRALVKLIDWAVSGEAATLYPSGEARAQAISALAALPREELTMTPLACSMRILLFKARCYCSVTNSGSR